MEDLDFAVEKKSRSISVRLYLLFSECWRIRNVVLALLVLQTTTIVLLMHHSRNIPRAPGAGPKYLASAAVFMAEAMKLPFVLAMAARACGGMKGLRELLQAEVLGQKMETLKCSVPALAYTIQGNLLFVALGALDPPTYQVAYQTKTLFTALFSRYLLDRHLEVSQWLALVLLFAGTVLASDLSERAATNPGAASPLVGLAAVIFAAILSSLSSVYFEKMLKKPARTSLVEAAGLWLRNIQLGAFALPLSGLGMIFNDGAQLSAYGVLHGFDGLVWTVVLLNGCGGLLVAATMKYADNIVKCFAAALAIICSTMLSVPLFAFELRPIFLVGSGLTIVATVLYSRAPQCTLQQPGRQGRPLLAEDDDDEASALQQVDRSPGIGRV